MKIVTKSPICTLTICVLSALLSACGGESDSSSSSTEEQNLSLSKARAISNEGTYPEPNKDLPNANTLGFYDEDAQGNVRAIRNDLIGDFAAMVQFAQSHTVDPNGNEAKNMPRLTSEKDALLLVTPTTEMGDVQQLRAEIYQNSRLVRTIMLNEPSQIAASNQSNNDNRPPIQYSNRAWSAALNWDEIKPGLNIRIVDSVSRKNGRLAANKIDFAAPAELLVQSIRLGFLANWPGSSDYYKHHMLLDPAIAGAGFLQTIPAAKIMVSRYDDVRLSKVMVANGTIYDTASVGDGGVHSGDMRENTAKSTYSTGINLANWGITSASMASQSQPQLTQSVVIHHAQGMYQNGLQVHGLSGGNGILTLYRSRYNEFSHEIGHHFGLGHNNGQPGACQNADSGWGYSPFRNRMLGNLNWNSAQGNDGCVSFKGWYGYGQDPMNSGSPYGSFTEYTAYTGYSTKTQVQPNLDRAVWNANSATGYKKWNATTRQMEEFRPALPKTNDIWYSGLNTTGYYLKPKQFGVPVLTILGGYDPANNSALLYPAARGNWGNVFDLPQVNNNNTEASCWLNVQFTNKAAENIALAPTRLQANSVNKLHVNLAQSDNPRQVDLYCKKANEQAVRLSSIEIPNYTQPLPEPVMIGQSDGFTALRKIELPQLEQAFTASQGKMVIGLSANEKTLYDSYKNFKNELSAPAQTEMARYTEQQNQLYRLNRWVNVYRTYLNANNTDATSAFKRFVTQLGLNNSNPLADASMFTMPALGNACLKVERVNETAQPSIFVSGKNGCTGEASTLWIYDAMGKIHSAQYPELCLAGTSLVSCNNGAGGQIWTAPVTGNTQQFRQGNQCLDLSGGGAPAANGRGALTMYGCGGGNNQKWTIVPQSQNFILAAAQAQNLVLIINSLQP